MNVYFKIGHYFPNNQIYVTSETKIIRIQKYHSAMSLGLGIRSQGHNSEVHAQDFQLRYIYNALPLKEVHVRMPMKT